MLYGVAPGAGETWTSRTTTLWNVVGQRRAVNAGGEHATSAIRHQRTP